MNDDRLYERYVRLAVTVLMKELGVSGRELATRLGTSPGEISRTTTSNMESQNSRTLSIDKAWAYASALGVTMSEVVEQAEALMARSEVLWVDDDDANGGEAG
ncbi:helix-turn-helix domain-containing protein [Nakamurella lactea]|uniref:helix-turn-helix domain-containing protein n=1 Tax=Nakamurella lactea TaxID=459515 RepID=UPI000491C8C3|nr:helix-turn-helix transcriptional regulator [Nakamurella lactea]